MPSRQGSASRLFRQPDTIISDLNETDFQSLTEHSADIICRVVGPGLILQYVSPSSEQILGWKPAEMIGKGPTAFVHPDDVTIVAEAAIRLRGTGADYAPVQYRMIKKDGQSVWMEVSARIVPGTPVDVEEVVLVMRDVTERKAFEEQLQALALTDGLTGLSNRRAFDDALQREWLRALRDGSHVSLLLIDLDHFKEINDRYGHPVGDHCLRAVAAVILHTVRATDIVSRYGGEEITVILPSADSAGAAETAEKVRSAIENLHLPHNDASADGSRLTASIGAATALFGNGIASMMPQRLLKAADTALYEAKREGRNRVAAITIPFPQAELLQGFTHRCARRKLRTSARVVRESSALRIGGERRGVMNAALHSADVSSCGTSAIARSTACWQTGSGGRDMPDGQPKRASTRR